ncbi:LRR receptor-like Serine/Threonine-kinase [Rhynchospora pubera]|uniref:LRR receptor-like Serine/Threonine-kinase n=1 Tax=Rhynchospora pubera TaxID=906938 RepID=A0AAV8DN65_9POAL|nr:LRR receptor-like Serine/Threonine-kinase [Rhynchospora pubera]
MLDHLQFLDLSNNNFSGHIPTHMDNLTAMANLSFPEVYDYENLPATVKGIDLKYNSNSLKYLISIDLSNNNLTGTIPDTIVALSRLMNLNLSNNHLIGKIPTEIGNMKSLESLDLRMNNLSGSIPQSMSTLNSLAVLNLSYNNLSGPIPRGYQLQTLDNSSIYMGNPYLCGPPVKTSCHRSSAPSSSNNEGYSGDREKLWFYLFVEFGFVTGVLGLFLFLLFKRSQRHAYFRIVDKLFDMIYVLGTLTFKRLREQT